MQAHRESRASGLHCLALAAMFPLSARGAGRGAAGGGRGRFRHGYFAVKFGDFSLNFGSRAASTRMCMLLAELGGHRRIRPLIKEFCFTSHASAFHNKLQ